MKLTERQISTLKNVDNGSGRLCNKRTLKPIGYMSLTGVENIHDCGSSTVHDESDDKQNIPVYIQY